MSFGEQDIGPNSLDEATRRRLASLRSMPVDLSRLTKFVETSIPKRNLQQRRLIPGGWLRPIRLVAASLLFMGLLMVAFVLSSSGPALASPDRLAAIHAETMESKEGTAVTSIADADRQIKSEWAGAPALPSVGGHEVRSCCLHHLDKKRLACVQLKINHTPVTLIVADAQDVKCPHAQMVMRNGVNYCIMSSGNLNIIMWENQGRWASLVSTLPAIQLIDSAVKIHF